MRNEFEEWVERHMDGPMPAVATVDSLRKQFKYVLVDRESWEQSETYSAAVDGTSDTCMGGGTSTSYKFFAWSSRGLGAVRWNLRDNRSECALCELISLTKAMADCDEWWRHTDAP